MVKQNFKPDFKFYRATHLETGEVKLIVARNDEELFFTLDEYASPYEFVIEEIDPESLPPLSIDFTPDEELKKELTKLPSLRILTPRDLDRIFKKLVFQ